MSQIDWSPRELAIVLAALAFWATNPEDDDPDDPMKEELEQAAFGDAGQPRHDGIAQILEKLYPFKGDVQPV